MHPSGTFTFEDQQWASFSATSLTWTHGVTLLSDTGTGDLTAGFDTYVFGGCQDSDYCSSVPADPQEVLITPLSTYQFQWIETDTAITAAGEIDSGAALDLFVEYLSTPADDFIFGGSDYSRL